MIGVGVQTLFDFFDQHKVNIFYNGSGILVTRPAYLPEIPKFTYLYFLDIFKTTKNDVDLI